MDETIFYIYYIQLAMSTPGTSGIRQELYMYVIDVFAFDVAWT